MQRGEVVIAPQFDLAGDFYQGLAEVLVRQQDRDHQSQGRDHRPAACFGAPFRFTKDVILAVEGTWTSGYYEGFEELPD